MRLSPADNVVIYSSLSIKNIIPNQKPIIPQAPPTTRHFVCPPCSLPYLPSYLSLFSVNLALLAHHQSSWHAKRRRGREVEAQRHCHGKSKYYFFSPPFFCLSFGDFCYNFAGTEQTRGTTSCQLNMCVCVSYVNVCECLCVGCGRWRWQIIAAISMTLPSLLSSLIFGVAWRGVRWGGVSG